MLVIEIVTSPMRKPNAASRTTPKKSAAKMPHGPSSGSSTTRISRSRITAESNVPISSIERGFKPKKAAILRPRGVLAVRISVNSESMKTRQI